MPTCVFSQASCVTVVYLKCMLKCIHDGAYFYRHSRLHQVVKECRHQPNSGVLPFAEQYISLAWQQPVNTFNDSTSSGSYFAPAGCEILRLGCRSLYIGISVFFLCVYLFAGLSQKSNVLTTLKLNVLPMTPMAVVRSSSDARRRLISNYRRLSRCHACSAPARQRARVSYCSQ